MTCLHKGDKAYVEGELIPRTYVGKNGETKVSLDVTASDVRFLTEKSDRGATNNPVQETSRPNNAATSSDELPF